MKPKARRRGLPLDPSRRRADAPTPLQGEISETGEEASAHSDASRRPTRSPKEKREKGNPIRVLDVGWGAFDHVTRLNPSFRSGVPRLRLTLGITAGGRRTPVPAFLEALSEFLPSLSLHRCCGGNDLQESFFQREQRKRCAVSEADDGVDLAHLLEHVLIDLMHHVGRLNRCSGVTCAWTNPKDRYDVFVESEEEKLGRACAGIALDLVVDLLEGRALDARYQCLLEVARLAHEHAGWPIGPRVSPLVRTWGREIVDASIASLEERGYLSRSASSFNFSGHPLLAYEPASMPGHLVK